MKKFLFLAVVVLLLVAGLIYIGHPQSASTGDLTKFEPVVIGMTRALSAFIVEMPTPASCTVPAFSAYIASSTPNWSNVFSDFICDLKVRGEDGIFIIQDKRDQKLLFEDGTWTSGIDAPHWRMPNLPRLAFPINSGGDVK